ncbi:IS5/IS1182 family transposase, partial [Rhodococcus wratislaviensis]
WLRERGIVPRIARRGIERNDRLGRYRWKIERTMCAARRSVVSPVQPGRTRREVLGSGG